jgi:hypothetical protein
MPDPTHASGTLPRSPLPPAADEGQGRDEGSGCDVTPPALAIVAKHHRAKGMGRTEFAVLCLAAGLRIGAYGPVTGPAAAKAWDEADPFVSTNPAYRVPSAMVATEAGQAPSPSTEESGRNDGR